MKRKGGQTGFLWGSKRRAEQQEHLGVWLTRELKEEKRVKLRTRVEGNHAKEGGRIGKRKERKEGRIEDELSAARVCVGVCVPVCLSKQGGMDRKSERKRGRERGGGSGGKIAGEEDDYDDGKRWRN